MRRCTTLTLCVGVCCFAQEAVMLYCSNANCTIQLLQKIVQYCSKLHSNACMRRCTTHLVWEFDENKKSLIANCCISVLCIVVVAHYSLVQIAVSLHRNVSLNMCKCTSLQFCANCTNCATTCANNLCKLHRNVSPHRCRPGPDLPLLPSCCPTRYMITTIL